MHLITRKCEFLVPPRKVYELLTGFQVGRKGTLSAQHTHCRDLHLMCSIWHVLGLVESKS